MKTAGFLLLPAGWALVVATIALLPPGASRIVFLLAGSGIEALGLVLVFRSHLAPGPGAARR